MREIVSMMAGQCGNQIGAKFWEVISGELTNDRELGIFRNFDIVGVSATLLAFVHEVY